MVLTRESQSNNLALVPQWVAQQFYRHGLFCASQVGDVPPHNPLIVLFSLLWCWCLPLLE